MKNKHHRGWLVVALAASAWGWAAGALAADSRPPTTAPAGGPALRAVPVDDVRVVDDAFWSPKRDVWRRVTIADCFDKFDRDGAFANFDRVRDGQRPRPAEGGRPAQPAKHAGPPWYDGLVYEMITGASDFLRENPDEALQRRLDGYVARIAAAADQNPDGYLNTHTQLVEPDHRWGANGGNDREQHDLYNAGCLVEAGVHHFRATGKTDLLRVAARMANYMCDVMGPPPRRNLVPGHAIGEGALVDLYQLFHDQPDLKQKLPFAIDEKRYLALAKFWVDNRGNHAGRQDFGAYNQDHKPIVEQSTIEGHAVRATLLCAGVTELATATGDAGYRAAATRLWENMAARRMYVTGGLGAVANDEKFAGDYVLPSGGHMETCAAVGAAFFHERMAIDAGRARYADELERVLYNAALGGTSLSGDRCYYENPLEAGPSRLRWAWHACPCCPPMFLKLMGAMPGYLYATGAGPGGEAGADALYVNLYVSSTLRTKVGGQAVALRQTTRFPWEGDVRLTVEGDPPATFELNLRVPTWYQSVGGPDELYTPAGRPADGAFVVRVNGEPASPTVVGGYAKLHRQWKPGDVVEVAMRMPARRLMAHPSVADATGKVALSRGPLVYCLESIDHDGRVRNLSLPDNAELRAEFKATLLGGVTVVRATGLASYAGEAAPQPAEMTAVPFYAAANRGATSRRVWVPRSSDGVVPATLADAATPSASHCNPSDTVSALNDGLAAKSSDDESIPRFTWWDHRGSAEWAQYTFDRPTKLSAASVYWWDERRVNRHCRVPASWRLVYKTPAGEWAPVPGVSAYGVEMDKPNRVTFDPIETTALRIEAQLQPEWSAGILEWLVEPAKPSTATTAAQGTAVLAAAAQPAVPATAPAIDAVIHVDAAGPGRPLSKYLTGVCIEDVNHEIYGGIYSQMIFGESFQEPSRTAPVRGFVSPDGQWTVRDGEVLGGGGPGPKLVHEGPAFADGEAGVDVYLPAGEGGTGGRIANAGLIVRVGPKAAAGADNFAGYEVSIDVGRRRLLVGRHRQNYKALGEADCDVAPDKWVSLSVRLAGRTVEAFVDGKSVLRVEDPDPLPPGTVGLRQWQRSARYRNLWAKRGTDGPRTALPFESASTAAEVSGQWGPIAAGDAVLEAALEKDRPFVGSQSQRVTFARGSGEVGVENAGLNRRGMAFVAGKPYEGYVWLRADKPTEAVACLESRDGTKSYARAPLRAEAGGEWRRYDFALTPTDADTNGGFSLRLTAPGTVVVGHAFLQPGEWGRYKKLPVRRDVVEGLIDQGVTVLRYGGSMVNAPAYRWKPMLGPRDRRQPYRGHWYPHSTNGWGIVDFLDLCEAAGFLGIPDFNIDESPQDMADFVEYANGPADSEWGRRRVADGHPAPYRLRHIELGNEEKVGETYYAKFEKLAKAIWAKDPDVVLVVGDFQYERPITDPSRVEGAASRVTSLDAHRKILDLARSAGREVWFDVHVWTETPNTSSARALSSFIDAIDKLAAGAKHKVVVFEFNANTHDQRRALANAAAIADLIRDGRVPVALSANGLQPDGQNDNGWDQGLLSLDPSRVWSQPPGYVMQMYAKGYLPVAVNAGVEPAGGKGAADGKAPATPTLYVAAARGEDGKRLALYVVNLAGRPVQAQIRLTGFAPPGPTATVEELAGPPNGAHRPGEPPRVAPRPAEWRHEMKDGAATYTFPANSFTVIRME